MHRSRIALAVCLAALVGPLVFSADEAAKPGVATGIVPVTLPVSSTEVEQSEFLPSDLRQGRLQIGMIATELEKTAPYLKKDDFSDPPCFSVEDIPDHGYFHSMRVDLSKDAGGEQRASLIDLRRLIPDKSEENIKRENKRFLAACVKEFGSPTGLRLLRGELLNTEEKMVTSLLYWEQENRIVVAGFETHTERPRIRRIIGEERTEKMGAVLSLRLSSKNDGQTLRFLQEPVPDDKIEEYFGEYHAIMNTKTGYRALPSLIPHPSTARRFTPEEFASLSKTHLQNCCSVCAGHNGTVAWYAGSVGYILEIRFDSHSPVYISSICTFTPTLGMDQIDGEFAKDVEEYVLQEVTGYPTERLAIFDGKENVPVMPYLRSRGFGVQSDQTMQ